MWSKHCKNTLILRDRKNEGIYSTKTLHRPAGPKRAARQDIFNYNDVRPAIKTVQTLAAPGGQPPVIHSQIIIN
jgi:hypothetical protein